MWSHSRCIQDKVINLLGLPIINSDKSVGHLLSINNLNSCKEVPRGFKFNLMLVPLKFILFIIFLAMSIIHVTHWLIFCCLSDLAWAKASSRGVATAFFAASVGGVSICCVPHFATALSIHRHKLAPVYSKAKQRWCRWFQYKEWSRYWYGLCHYFSAVSLNFEFVVNSSLLHRF